MRAFLWTAAVSISIVIAGCLGQPGANSASSARVVESMQTPQPPNASLRRTALKGEICFPNPGTPSLKSIAVCLPVGVMYARFLNVPPIKFTHGFPGVSDRRQWFRLDFRGHFNVSAAGDFNFRLFSQDGSMLWIDEQLVIDNDGLHEPTSKSGTHRLASGEHSIRVLYFHGDGPDVALQLFVTPPDGTERLWTTQL